MSSFVPFHDPSGDPFCGLLWPTLWPFCGPFCGYLGGLLWLFYSFLSCILQLLKALNKESRAQVGIKRTRKGLCPHHLHKCSLSGLKIRNQCHPTAPPAPKRRRRGWGTHCRTRRVCPCPPKWQHPASCVHLQRLCPGFGGGGKKNKGKKEKLEVKPILKVWREEGMIPQCHSVGRACNDCFGMERIQVGSLQH